MWESAPEWAGVRPPYSPSHCGGAEQIIRGNRPDDNAGDGFLLPATMEAQSRSLGNGAESGDACSNEILLRTRRQTPVTS